MTELLSPATAAVRIVITGRVQGVGLRPALARLAQRLSLAGEVCNSNAGVEIAIQGESASISEFLRLVAAHAPLQARIDDIDVHPAVTRDRNRFEIVCGERSGPLATPPPLDLVVCCECLSEVGDTASRRWGYPFTSCTACGPRFSVLQALPYERRATSLAEFELCDGCRGEYGQPADRRFHAETMACPECGPRCWLANGSGFRVAEQQAAIDAAIAALRRGEIVALRGIGGYQLLADATSEAAVRRLRERKRRPAKPLAVLVESLAAAARFAELDTAAASALSQPAGPIVVVPANADSPLATSIHPGLHEVGLLLPTSPLHWFMVRNCPPLVATSGNLEGRPLEYDLREAQSNLAGVADLVLDHDRPIVRPIDDSVVKLIAGSQVTLRLARGLAPLPLELGQLGLQASGVHALAVGGQQNNAVALWNGCQAILGPHIGDLDELRTCERWHEQRCALGELLYARPSLLVHDQHPDYYTTRWTMESCLPAIAVQHHHAHIAAIMLEHGWLDREVLGVAWDGTGWGSDGTIWGGEFLRATAAGYRRVARLRPLALPGGEAAIRQPWRVALGLLAEVLGSDDAMRFVTERGWPPEPLSSVIRVCQCGLALQTSSIGRMFDAAATIALPREQTAGGHAQYEGQLAMFLEAACNWPAVADQNAEIEQPYSLPLVAGDPAELDWRPLLTAIVADCRAGVPPAAIAQRFHAALADAVVAVSNLLPELPVVLGGGVFQNRVLTEMIVRRFASRPQRLGLPGVIPPGDGGLAAGQLVVALARRERNRQCA